MHAFYLFKVMSSCSENVVQYYQYALSKWIMQGRNHTVDQREIGRTRLYFAK